MEEPAVEKGFPLDVGKFRCTIFSDGFLSGEGEGNDEKFGLNCLYIESAENKILIDCGGDGFQSTTGRLVRNMEASGVRRSGVDTIIITHGHIDHVAGTHNSKGEPVFPGARYVTTKKEWQYWETPPGSNELQNMFFAPARKFLLPIKGQFELADDNAEALPSIRLIPAHGHTPGNVMVEISSDGQRLLCIGDIIHSQREFMQPDYLSSFDVQPEAALKTRAEVLNNAAKSGVLTFACHFPFPGLGYIRRKEGLLTWQSIQEIPEEVNTS